MQEKDLPGSCAAPGWEEEEEGAGGVKEGKKRKKKQKGKLALKISFEVNFVSKFGKTGKKQPRN